jgi:Beta-propeller repeat
MKYRRYGINLIVFVSVLAALVLRTHVPMTTAKEALGTTAVKGDATTARFKVSNRSHVTALARASQTQLLKSYGKLPLSFEANQGQTNSQVQFLARGVGYTLFLTSTEAVLSFHGRGGSTRTKPRLAEALQARHSPSSAAGVKLRIPPLKDGAALLRHGETRNLPQSQLPSSPEPGASAVLRVKLVGANPSPRVTGLEELTGKSNYFLGRDRKKWRTNVSKFARVSYAGIYPGIDLIYYGSPAKPGELEYDFVVAPGANPRAIKFAIQGGTKIAIDAGGDLVAELDGQEMRLHKPLVYQPEKRNSKLSRHNIEGNYVLTGDNQVGFRVSAYDPQKALVIDPVLKYSTYLGGSGDDWGSVFNFIRAIAVDPQGNAYVIGTANSIDFPTTADAYQKQFAGGGGGFINPFGDAFATGDVFVAKLNPAGNALVYSTYLGGSADDYGEGIAVDAAGNAYLAGMTDSTDFPTMNPIQKENAGLADMFLAKLNATGSTLVYSTYLGGSDSDGDPMIVLDPRGHLYFEAWTFSTDIPTANPFQSENAGASDIWAGKLNAAGNTLIYSTYLGGSDFDICGSDIVVDPAGNNYLNGVACSTDFPTQNPIQPENAGGCDAFLTKLNPAGNALVYSTYLGGSGDFEITSGTAVDAAGDVYVTGGTSSSDFPTVNPIQAAYAGNVDAFVAKVNRNGTALVYSTYLGGTNFDFGRGIIVDAARNSYIVGGTVSTDFPTANPFQAANAGDEDVFLIKLNRTGNALVFSTYLGGSSWEAPSGIALGPSGDAYIQGTTASSDFPLVKALQSANAGGLDAFVARIRPTTVSDTSLSH